MCMCVGAEIRESQPWPSRSKYLERSHEKKVNPFYYFLLETWKSSHCDYVVFCALFQIANNVIYGLSLRLWLWSLCCVSNGGKRIIKSKSGKMCICICVYVFVYMYVYLLKSEHKWSVFSLGKILLVHVQIHVHLHLQVITKEKLI